MLREAEQAKNTDSAQTEQNKSQKAASKKSILSKIYFLNFFINLI